MPRPCTSLLASLLLAMGIGLPVTPAQASDPVTEFSNEAVTIQHKDHNNGTITSVPTIEAFYLDGQIITLDGVLDEEVWSFAETGWGFRQASPVRFGEASVASTFKVAYDDEAIYFAMANWEDDISNISSYLSRRDQIEASDIVSIYIDPYHDRTTGYNFRVNPAGVQQDAYIYDNGNRDEDWNAVWESEVSWDEKGWYAELRIPFSAIRFKPDDDMTWGLQVYRWLHGRGEDTGWVNWDRDSNGFVSRFGTLTGLRGVHNPRKLEILPYVVTRHTDPAAEGSDDEWNNFQNMGADFKYGVSSNLTLNATIQPDFGQVEADPATLNLSPFETYFQEKRPFFVEGARFFQHPDFNLFYSRRIGTGDPNSRIRAAGKLTGKIGGDFSLAVLAATTDVAVPGKVHNPFVAGDAKTHYGLLRLGKDFDEGNHNFNLMGTVTKRDENSFNNIDYFDNGASRVLRDGYSGGMDFEMNFDDRMYRLSGSVVGTVVDPFENQLDPALSRETKYGTGGRMEFSKTTGTWRGELAGSWESDKLDPNDMGFLSAPDEKFVVAEGGYYFDADGEDSPFNHAHIDLEIYRSWLYAGNSATDINTGDEAWNYGSGHFQGEGIQLEAWAQTRGFHQAWIFMGRSNKGTDKYATRGYGAPPNNQRGPLITKPGHNNIAIGGQTDYRKPASLNLEFNFSRGDEGMREFGVFSNLRWNQSQHFSHSLGFGYNHSYDDYQWMTNQANDGSQPGVTGIGGVDYLFGKLDQETFDITLRSNILFNRDQSLQIYLQPYLTYGNYTEATWLATPDSYDLRSYDRDASLSDFEFGAVNLNMVYRWEYRPGSTIYLVWTHGKQRYEERAGAPDPTDWNNDFDVAYPFRTEPENTFMAKFSYWFSI
jgi:Domain of unknown function (DUF5916)/Carbohydrate family 9 binding domain-like